MKSIRSKPSLDQVVDNIVYNPMSYCTLSVHELPPVHQAMAQLDAAPLPYRANTPVAAQVYADSHGLCALAYMLHLGSIRTRAELAQ